MHCCHLAINKWHNLPYTKRVEVVFGKQDPGPKYIPITLLFQENIDVVILFRKCDKMTPAKYKSSKSCL